MENPKPKTAYYSALTTLIIGIVETAAVYFYLSYEWFPALPGPLSMLLSLVITSVFSIGLAVLLIALRRGAKISVYLGFHVSREKMLAAWVVAGAVYLAILALLNHWLRRPPEPDYYGLTLATTPVKIGLFIVLIIGAPLAEEIFYRGFLYRGFEASAIGRIGAVILTTGFWTVGHGQYVGYDLVIVAATGLFLGTARASSGSLWTSILLHVMFNALVAVG